MARRYGWGLEESEDGAEAGVEEAKEDGGGLARRESMAAQELPDRDLLMYIFCDNNSQMGISAQEGERPKKWYPFFTSLCFLDPLKLSLRLKIA